MHNVPVSFRVNIESCILHKSSYIATLNKMKQGGNQTSELSVMWLVTMYRKYREAITRVLVFR